MLDQTLARKKLFKGKYSCVLVRDGKIIMASYDKGIRPIFSKLAENKKSLQNAVLADKVVGKALALLCLLAEIKSVYGYVISNNARFILESKGVDVEYNEIVPYIMNKDETDKCPMEKLVNNIEDPEKAFDAISDFFREKPIKGVPSKI